MMKHTNKMYLLVTYWSHTGDKEKKIYAGGGGGGVWGIVSIKQTF